MTAIDHTPGPWKVEQGECNPLVVAQTEDGPLAVAEVLDDCYPETKQQLANANLIAAAPDLLAELRETADWLDERADALLKVLANPSGWRTGAAVQENRQAIRDEAARLRGRAAVIRQTAALKATRGA